MSDPSSSAGGCCRCCCSFILTSGLTALFMWLSLRGSKPSCSIEDFYVPSLNATDNSTTTRSNHTLYFDLRLKNEMKDKGVGYDDLNLTFFYVQNGSLGIANYTVPSFYQGHDKKARRKELVQTYGVPWEAAYRAVSNGSTVTFRVGLTTRVRYKILFWYTKRHGLKVGANVDVNNSGKKVNKKGIRLKSGAPESVRCPGLVVISIALYFLVLLL
ncbi:protein NDR1 [Coffea arabica]|uniref:Non-race specific disease resistance protein 1-like protein b n=1 Tax=Coffea arabica TaxID=13443 RepID=D2CFI3_COFAR|nr:non-race specific disease resistance protein 1-like protein b [Coffea arabica]